MEATGILGSLAGIAELAKSSIERQQEVKVETAQVRRSGNMPPQA
jgi:hypothetical protein